MIRLPMTHSIDFLIIRFQDSLMVKPKKKLTSAQRAAKKQRKKDFMTVFMNGKQVRVRREPTIDGIDVEEFVSQNADPIWLHQNGTMRSCTSEKWRREKKPKPNLPLRRGFQNQHSLQ